MKAISLKRSLSLIFALVLAISSLALPASADSISYATTFDAGLYHNVFLQSDGTVAAFGASTTRRLAVEDWENIIAVSASDHTVGLKSDGTCVATGPDKYGQCSVYYWENIVAIAAGERNTVGLKADGTVEVAGCDKYDQFDARSWKDIVAVAAGGSTLYGVKANGTVVAAGSNLSGQANVSAWSDIVAVAAGNTHVVGLRSDGTCVSAGSNTQGEGDVRHWANIVSISAGSRHTVGLKAGGTVVATGTQGNGECATATWSDIAAVAAGAGHTIGLKSNGKLIATGSNGWGQCNVPSYRVTVAPDARPTLSASPSRHFSFTEVDYLASLKMDLQYNGKVFDWNGSRVSGNTTTYSLHSDVCGSLDVLVTVNPQGLVESVSGCCCIAGLSKEQVASQLDSLISVYCAANPDISDENLASLFDPSKASVDSSGNLYVSNDFNNVHYTFVSAADSLMMMVFPSYSS